MKESGPPVRNAVPELRYGDGLRFARRMHLPRTIGLGLGGLCVAAVLYERRAPWFLWLLLGAHTLVWPHVAYVLATRTANPRRTELRSLVIDSAFGGAWVPVMAFNLLPSVLVAVTLTMDKLAVGGPRFLLRGVAAMLAAGAATAFATGFEVDWPTSAFVLLACMPHLVAYPVVVGMTTYRLSRRIRSQNRRLAQMGRMDGLSQLANRMYWEEIVADEFQRCTRGAARASLLMLDIDHFKDINDGHGHAVGDEVIRQIADILRQSVRAGDTIGRYGGEEFGVVLPGTSPERAWVVAERIRERVAAAELEKDAAVRATVSIGLVALDSSVRDYTEWIKRADRALYRAKALGRNRIESVQ